MPPMKQTQGLVFLAVMMTDGPTPQVRRRPKLRTSTLHCLILWKLGHEKASFVHTEQPLRSIFVLPS
jgi:hypothetical protein